MLSQENQETIRGNMHGKFGEVIHVVLNILMDTDLNLSLCQTKRYRSNLNQILLHMT